MISRSQAALCAAFTLLCSSAAWPGRAQSPGNPALTRRSAAEEALRANPDLRAAHASIDVARGNLVQVGLWPNPALEFSARDDFAFRSEGERAQSLGFAQRFPVAGRLARAREVGQLDVARALAEARDFERTLIGEVQRSVTTLLVLDRAVARRAQVADAVRRLAAVSGRRFRAAEVSEADLNLLEVDVARLDQERRRLELERQSEAVRFCRLLYRPVDSPVIVEGEVEQAIFVARDSSELGRQALARRPDLQLRRLDADRARAEAQLARAEVWEDWTVGASVESDRSVFRDEPAVDPIGTKRDTFAGLALVVPLPLWNRNQGRIAAAEAGARQAEAKVESLERAIEAEVETGRRRLATLTEIELAYRETLLPRSERNLELLDRAYRQGLANISALVQAEQQLADAALRHVQALGDLRQAEIDLETAAAASPLLAEHGEQESR